MAYFGAGERAQEISHELKPRKTFIEPSRFHHSPVEMKPRNLCESSLANLDTVPYLHEASTSVAQKPTLLPGAAMVGGARRRCRAEDAAGEVHAL